MRILALLLLLSACATAEPMAVIGDSITASKTSWANRLTTDEQPMYIMAQSGRTIRDYDMPRDWWARNYRVVIYFIGTNDIIQDQSLMKVQRIFRQHIEFMQARRFKPIVILPPVYPDYVDSSLAIRKMMKATCSNHKVSVIDLDEAWEPWWTFDGIHPTTQGQALMAQYISEKLGDIL